MIGDLFDSPWKILIVAVVLIMLFGSKKLPGAARSLGQSMRILKEEAQGLYEDELPVPLENRIRQETGGSSGYDLRFFGVSGGACVFVDQAAQDGFSVDPFAVEVGNDEVATVVFTVGDALGDALMRPGRVVVHLVFGQDCAEMV